MLVIVSNSKNAVGVQTLVEAAERLGVSVQVVVIGVDDVAAALASADQVIYRISPRMFAQYRDLLDHLPAGHAKDTLGASLVAFSKIDSDQVFVAHALAVPESWIMQRGDRHDAPFVIKIATGNKGKGVELIHNSDDLAHFYETYSDQQQFLAQEYIEEAGASDKRLFVIGDQVVAAMKRSSSTDDFRANLSLGGSGETYNPTDQERDVAVSALKALGLQYAGVDIIDSKRGPLLLEVNPSPGFGISKVTGVAVADILLTYMTGETT